MTRTPRAVISVLVCSAQDCKTIQQTREPVGKGVKYVSKSKRRKGQTRKDNRQIEHKTKTGRHKSKPAGEHSPPPPPPPPDRQNTR